MAQNFFIKTEEFPNPDTGRTGPADIYSGYGLCHSRTAALAARAIGNIVTSTKQHLLPEFPEMPTTVINGQGGFFGVLHPPVPPPESVQSGAAPPAAPALDDGLHNLYEEILV